MLQEGLYTARDLSAILGIKEKEVYEHLPHVEKSLGKGANIISEPARCLACGFEFKKRRRFTTPGKCPLCRSESIVDPLFGVNTPGNRKTGQREDSS
jgi:predicted Zn-ribbon and HTH transcriptional regulator